MSIGKINKKSGYMTIVEECPVCGNNVVYTKISTHKIRCCNKCWYKIKKLMDNL